MTTRIAPLRRSATHLLLLLLTALIVGVPVEGAAAQPGRATTTCTDSWTNPLGGDWFTPGNWSGGVPTSGDDACITLDGTYTVTMSSSASVTSLTVGGTTGTQTLSLAATSSESSSLQATVSVSIGTLAVVDLTANSGTNSSLLEAPTITNSGALTVSAGTGGDRYLRGGVVNNGKTIVANGVVLSMSGGGTFTNATGGALNPTGTNGHLQLSGSTYNANGGSYGGHETTPILIDNGSLNINSPAGFGAELRGTVNLSGNVSTAQTLALNATSSESMILNVGVNLTSAGTLTLNSLSGTNDVRIQMSGKKLTSSGLIMALAGTGGARSIQGNLVNNHVLTVEPGVTLQLSGTYTQGPYPKGTFNTGVDASGPGQLIATGSLTLNGTLAIKKARVVPATGSFPILTGASLSGTFVRELGAVIKSSKYFLATYSPTIASITVTTASISLSQSGGPPGTILTVSGSGYPPNDAVTIAFKDAAGTTTTLANPTTTATGTFSIDVTMPGGAAVGKGKVSAESKFTAVTAKQVFTVG